MLKAKTKSVSTETNGHNGHTALPRASDFKLPKKLSKARKERIEMGQEFLKAIRDAYGREQKAEG